MGVCGGGYWGFGSGCLITIGAFVDVSLTTLIDASSGSRVLWSVDWMIEWAGSSSLCAMRGFGCVLVYDEPESLILAQSERWRHA